MPPILQKLGLDQPWLAFGHGQSLRYISVHDLCDRSDQEKINGMFFFHASPVFSKLSQYPLAVERSDMDILERFVIPMYDRSGTAATVDEARLDLFARKQRPYIIKPTKSGGSDP